MPFLVVRVAFALLVAVEEVSASTVTTLSEGCDVIYAMVQKRYGINFDKNK